MTKVKDYRLVEYPETKPPLEKFLDKLSGKDKEESVVKAAVEREIQSLAPEYIAAKRLLLNNKIQARLPMILNFN